MRARVVSAGGGFRASQRFAALDANISQLRTDISRVRSLIAGLDDL